MYDERKDRSSSVQGGSNDGSLKSPRSMLCSAQQLRATQSKRCAAGPFHTALVSGVSANSDGEISFALPARDLGGSFRDAERSSPFVGRGVGGHLG